MSARSGRLLLSALFSIAMVLLAVLPTVAARPLTTPAALESAITAPPDSLFQKVPLDTSTANPMMLDVAADGRVFYVERLGDVRIIRPSGGTVLAAHLNVFTANESGLLGIALDPGFATDSWIYLYYSPSATSVDRLSRFTAVGDTVDLSSEKIVLDVPVQRDQCCHHGAGLTIDKNNGNLWLAPGDNTNPFDSDGYTPIDEQPGRAAFDAQRTAGNTNNLSGKVLRIHPEPDGTYTIPSGNLFPPGTPGTRAEIYLMGERNPFRIAVDPKTGNLIVGNFGPDAQTANPARGPQNTVEWDIVSHPGNAGWPYCIGPNTPYVDYNFATGVSGAPFDCAGGPTNNSPNNTGQTTLPPAMPATVWYHYTSDPASFPQLAGGGPIAGPVYRYDPALVSSRKWPQYFDGRAIFGEWTKDELFTFQLAVDSSGVTSIDRLLSSMTFLKPMDFKFGPDGALYEIEWGTGFGDDNPDSGIYRVDYLNGSALPIAQASANPTGGHAPLTVAFSSAGSFDPANLALTYSWDFGDGTTSTDPNPSHVYTSDGNFNAILTVTASDGNKSTASVAITVGNTAPTVTLTAPPDGGFFDWGDTVNYSVTVTDPEDGTIDCGTVTVQAFLGHDTHGHPLDQHSGCTGTIQTLLSSGHSDGDNVFYVLEASYTDHGGTGGSLPLTGRSKVVLQPKRKQAEFFSQTGRTADGVGTDAPGVAVQTGADHAGGGQDIGYIQDGDWWSVQPASLVNINSVRLRVASSTAGGNAELHWNSPTGPLLGTATVPGTGAWQTYVDVTANITSPPTTSGAMYVVARSPNRVAGYLYNVNWIDFIGQGATAEGPKVISLRARVNGKYVTADNAGTSPLVANRTAIGPWEQFDEFDISGGMVALRSHADGDYVCAENAGASPLIANRNSVGPWEQFKIVTNADGSVSLKANINGMYVTAENAGASSLIANRTSIGPWEEFDLIVDG